MALKGQMIIWCSTCGRYYSGDEHHVCPECHTKSTTMKCYRCGHVWELSTSKLPKTCPAKRCKSPYWNRARTLRRAEE